MPMLRGPITSRKQGHTLSVSSIHLKQHLHACKNEVCGHIAATKFPAVCMSFIRIHFGSRDWKGSKAIISFLKFGPLV